MKISKPDKPSPHHLPLPETSNRLHQHLSEWFPVYQLQPTAAHWIFPTVQLVLTIASLTSFGSLPWRGRHSFQFIPTLDTLPQFPLWELPEVFGLLLLGGSCSQPHGVFTPRMHRQNSAKDSQGSLWRSPECFLCGITSLQNSTLQVPGTLVSLAHYYLSF